MYKTPFYPYIAFENLRCIAKGDLKEVAQHAKMALDRPPHTSVLIFESATSQQVEIDFRGTIAEVLNRLTPAEEAPAEVAAPVEVAKVGRPKLGVVAREITLLPRHWDWLATQPGGASVTLRRLVEEAKRANQSQDEARQRDEALTRFMTVMAGDLVGYEEASRAFYRRDQETFDRLIDLWPHDVREHVQQLASLVDWSAPNGRQ